MLQMESTERQHHSAVAPVAQHKTSAEVNVIKVAATSKTTSVAGAIAGTIRDHSYAEVQAVGAGAVNQAVKAVAVARGYLEEEHINIICIPYFTEITID